MSSPIARAATAATGLAALVAVAAPARAQTGNPTNAPTASPARDRDPAPGEVGVVRGRVAEAGSQRPISDAQVLVVGTTVGTITNAAGEYVLPRVPVGARTIRVRRIGFGAADRAVTVAAGAEVRADVALTPAATSLDQVVVTGTAVATTRRTLGNAVSQLDVTELTQKSTVTNVTDVLQGKTPGVMLLPGSGTPGTAADIRIRGTSSLVGSNRPIFFIDGIRYYDGQQGNLSASGNGISNAFTQGTSALDVLNPNDIESIEVIKGPAAATLYGADAAGGVIQIITKKGARGAQRPSWNARADVGANDFTLQWPTNYTTCSADRITGGANAASWPGCAGLAAGTVITGNPLQDDPGAFRNGRFQNFNGSVRGGTDRSSYYVSGERTIDEGIYRNSYNNRRGARANFSFAPTEKLDVNAQAAYTQSALRLPYESEGALGLVISGVRGQPGNSRNDASGWRFQTPRAANAYENTTSADRTILGVTTNYRPLSWFRNRFTAGVDLNQPLANVFFPPNSQLSADADPTFASGVVVQQIRATHLYTFDYAGTISNTLPRSLGALTSEFTAGVQGTKTDVRFTQSRGDGLPGPDFRLVRNATTLSGSSDFSEQASLGYYAQEQIGYGNRLFATLAVRADDNSAFGTKFDRVFYPKASLSWVVSEEPIFDRAFQVIRADNFKFRAAYGQAGRAPGPYDAARTYGSVRYVNGANNPAAGLIPAAPGNENLRPERGTEFEGGFDASFLKGRASIEFTTYTKRTTDALLSLASAPSTGFTASQFINFGAIRNSGTELGVRVQPVATRPLAWDVNFNYSTNNNRLTKLTRPGISTIGVSNVYSGTGSTQRVREGYPVAAFWAADAKRKPDGSLDLTATNALQVDTAKYIGPMTPTREGTLATTFTFFGRLRLYALADFHLGHFLFNAKDRARSQGLLDQRLNTPGVTAIDTAYYTSGAILTPWVQRADYAKFRDLSLSFTIPERLLRRAGVSNAVLTVAGRNLGFLYKKYPGMDPEVSYVGQSSFLTGRSDFLNLTRIDSYATPMTRRITTSINLSF